MIYNFKLNCLSKDVPLIEWDIYTENTPEYYLSETKKGDLKGGWNGKGKFPIREWWIDDLSLVDNLPNNVEMENFV